MPTVVSNDGTTEVLRYPDGTLVTVPAPGSPGATAMANQSTILADISARQSSIQAWITANPGGAVLTAGQTLTLAEMLNGLCDLLLGLFGSTAGT